MKTLRLATCYFFAVLTPLFCQFTQQGPKLLGTGARDSAHFGSAVAISADGNTAAVGGNEENSGRGAVWFFNRTNGQWVQQGPSLSDSGPLMGFSVAISADGNTVIAGAPNRDTGVSVVFTRAGGVWTQQGPKLVGTGGQGRYSNQGAAVSLSADGNTAIVGGPSDGDQIGAAWIFTRSNGVWTQQGQKLVGTGVGGTYSAQGSSVALSADGNTALVGGATDSGGVGAAWVFVRISGAWVQQGDKLVGLNSAGSFFGTSAALSSDGNTAVLGGPGDGVSDSQFQRGAAWVFTRSNGVWTQQGSKLIGSGAVGTGLQGMSVALSNDGATLLVGGSGDSLNGAIWVFTRSNGVWTQQGQKLTGSDAEGTSAQGTSVTISADGNTAMWGGVFDANGGAAWVFTRVNGIWTQQGNKIIGSRAEGSASQGTVVALSSDGKTAAIGGPNDYFNIGATWVFSRANNVWSQQGKKMVGNTSGQGYSLALSADGITAAVGKYGNSGNNGLALVFIRNNGAWVQQGPELRADVLVSNNNSAAVALSGNGNTAVIGLSGLSSGSGAFIFQRDNGVWSQQGQQITVPQGIVDPQFGHSVAISTDGNTLIVGGPWDGYISTPTSPAVVGAAWVYTRTTGGWTQQGPKLVGTSNTPSSGQGSSVALSADGNTAVVGGAFDDDGKGAFWIFTRSNGIWTQQGPKLVGSGAVGASNQGASASISADGNIVLIGAPYDNVWVGAAWVFTRSSGVWAQKGSKLVATDAIGEARQGTSVSLSGDGTIALVGGPGDDSNKGGAWLYTASPFVPSTIASNPVGASFSVTGLGCASGTYITPAMLNWTPLAACTVTMTSPQFLAGSQYVFTKWENNSTNGVRAITAPTVPITYTATLGLPSAVPTPQDSGPLAPSGVNQTIVLKFSHPQGYQQLGVVNALINQYLDGNAACYIAYSQPLQVLYLVNDQGPGNGLSPGLTLGGLTGSASNSQCTVFSAGSSAIGNVNVLTLTLNIAFKNTFTGSKVIYLAAQSVGNVSSGWQTLGVSLIPETTATYPRAANMTPATGTTANQTISFTFQDAANVSNLQTAWALINTAIDGRQACYVAYYAPGNALYLYPDNGDGAAATNIVLTGTNTIQNSQCLISASGSSVVKSGNQLTLNLNITFKGAFSGPRGVWTAVQTLGGAQTSPWKAIGAWLAP